MYAHVCTKAVIIYKIACAFTIWHVDRKTTFTLSYPTPIDDINLVSLAVMVIQRDTITPGQNLYEYPYAVYYHYV